ncbi:phage holin family protein [Actinokineospora terrae]|uniref:Putative Holin-X, holin superfamily III n=1 Tax=Actinokineospora terrae TaxID=155974 RepID=A0A1H9K690_9PSEU|nr:phage holin family protein [Actinokineospora terrae]SEQ94639.1 Putative Holin-X, holin superfamily III [Actinokineospora terrae]
MNESKPTTRVNDPTEPSTGELVGRLGEQVSRLLRDELELAKVELKDKGKQAGVGAALGGTAGILAWFAVGTLVAAAVAGLATAVPVWASALIVAGALLLIAGGLAAIAANRVGHATPPIPEQAIKSTQRDVAVVKESAHR